VLYCTKSKNSTPAESLGFVFRFKDDSIHINLKYL
jgi:hypothetical protein